MQFQLFSPCPGVRRGPGGAVHPCPLPGAAVPSGQQLCLCGWPALPRPLPAGQRRPGCGRASGQGVQQPECPAPGHGTAGECGHCPALPTQHRAGDTPHALCEAPSLGQLQEWGILEREAPCWVWVLPPQLKAPEGHWTHHRETSLPPGVGSVWQKGWECGKLSDSAGSERLIQSESSRSSCSFFLCLAKRK